MLFRVPQALNVRLLVLPFSPAFGDRISSESSKNAAFPLKKNPPLFILKCSLRDKHLQRKPDKGRQFLTALTKRFYWWKTPRALCSANKSLRLKENVK